VSVDIICDSHYSVADKCQKMWVGFIEDRRAKKYMQISFDQVLLLWWHEDSQRTIIQSSIAVSRIRDLASPCYGNLTAGLIHQFSAHVCCANDTSILFCAEGLNFFFIV
jgi:hypothetical protein